MADYQHILVERQEHIGIVTLNRPKELNALNFQLVSELAQALEAFDRGESIRCIVLTGAGDRAFAAGADIKEMSDKSPIDMMMGDFQAWLRIRHIHKPMIAAVGGYAFGGGCELALHCDMIVASENARFDASLYGKTAARVQRPIMEGTIMEDAVATKACERAGSSGSSAQAKMVNYLPYVLYGEGRFLGIRLSFASCSAHTRSNTALPW